MASRREGNALSLAALAKASRVSPRTIRYYIHQRLLPSPGKRGRGARYDRVLVHRLRLIQLLQRDKWPLVRIAQHMSELDDAGVRRVLGEREDRREERGARKATGTTSSLHSPLSSLLPQIWERVRVSPALEISLRTTVSAKQRKRVDRLIQSARKIFEEK